MLLFLIYYILTLLVDLLFFCRSCGHMIFSGTSPITTMSSTSASPTRTRPWVSSCWIRWCCVATVTTLRTRSPGGRCVPRTPTASWPGCSRGWRSRRRTSSWWPDTTRCGQCLSTAPQSACCGGSAPCWWSTTPLPTSVAMTTICRLVDLQNWISPGLLLYHLACGWLAIPSGFKNRRHAG